MDKLVAAPGNAKQAIARHSDRMDSPDHEAPRPAEGDPGPETVPEPDLKPSPTPAPAAAPASRGHGRSGWLEGLAERPETTLEIPARQLAARSRRDFLLFAAGALASAAGAWWLLPDRTKARLLGAAARDRLDMLAARVGLSRENRERALDRALTFDDDVAEALTSKHRLVRTYARTEVTALPNNYNGQTPGPEYVPGWSLAVSGLASGRTERLTIDRLTGRFALADQVTRLVCVEGWSAIAWWGGIRFAEFLAAFPPAPGARWAAMRSAVNLDGAGRSDRR